MFTSQNLYYNILYIVLQIILFGLFLSLYNMEVFTAFLWLTEVVIILVCFFLLFNTTPSGNVSKLVKNVYSYKNLPILVLSCIISLNYTYWFLPEYSVSDVFIETYFYEDYYEALVNQNTNDLYGFYLSFYNINSVEFLAVGLLLLIGSLACVQLNRFLKTNKTITYASFFNIFDYLKDSVKILFLRKQSMTDQANTPASTRSFSKKKEK